MDGESKTMKTTNRIWELDVFRGICIIGVILVHMIFDLQVNFGLLTDMPDVYVFIQENGGILFIILSGICVTLGHHHIKRGLLVSAGALAVTLVTVLFFSENFHIKFGILHLLAFCMLTYGIYSKLPSLFALIFGTAVIAVGIWISDIRAENDTLFFLGLISKSFCAGDYFPILPNLGYFMVGTFLGKTVYKEKKTLFPKVNEKSLPIRALSWCGRQSFWIYLIHQPVLYALCMLVIFFINQAN